MLALPLSLALAFTGPLSDVLHLDVAEPLEVAAAVDSCRSALAGMSNVDEAKLASGGWKNAERQNESIKVFRNSQSKAVILTAGPPLAGSCLVRARLEDAASIGTASQVLEQRLGAPARRKERNPVYRLWRKDRQLIGLEAFDDGPGGQRHVIQLVVGELPKELQ